MTQSEIAVIGSMFFNHIKSIWVRQTASARDWALLCAIWDYNATVDPSEWILASYTVHLRKIIFVDTTEPY